MMVMWLGTPLSPLGSIYRAALALLFTRATTGILELEDISKITSWQGLATDSAAIPGPGQKDGCFSGLVVFGAVP